jgi:hypothetical protein
VSILSNDHSSAYQLNVPHTYRSIQKDLGQGLLNANGLSSNKDLLKQNGNNSHSRMKVHLTSPFPVAAHSKGSPQLIKHETSAADLADGGASMLSANEWVEIMNYQQELDQEKIKKEREAKTQKQLLNKHSLEQQLQAKKQRLLKEREDQKQLELMVMQTLKDKDLKD